jgi:hypothetical protein
MNAKAALTRLLLFFLAKCGGVISLRKKSSAFFAFSAVIIQVCARAAHTGDMK